ARLVLINMFVLDVGKCFRELTKIIGDRLTAPNLALIWRHGNRVVGVALRHRSEVFSFGCCCRESVHNLARFTHERTPSDLIFMPTGWWHGSGRLGPYSVQVVTTYRPSLLDPGWGEDERTHPSRAGELLDPAELSHGPARVPNLGHVADLAVLE